MNKSKGDMFPNCKTLNIIRGKCEFECKYCYMKFGQLAKIEEYHIPYHINEKAMQERIPKTKDLVFVGSTTDIWAPEASDMIWHVLDRTVYDDVPEGITWLFQTKYPKGYEKCLYHIPKRAILGITLESSESYGYSHISNAPPPEQRADDARTLVGYMRRSMVSPPHNSVFAGNEPPKDGVLVWEFPQKIMINIEPAMWWNLDKFLEMLKWIGPNFLSIGAESGTYFNKHHVPQPTCYEVIQLLDGVAHGNIAEQIYVKRNIYKLAEASQRKDFIKALHGLVDDHGVIVQGSPKCRDQEFFSIEMTSSISAPQVSQGILPGILPNGRTSSGMKESR